MSEENVMNESRMSEIYVEACRLGMMDERNNFLLRMNPELVVSLDQNSCRIADSLYAYGVGECRIIADASVGSYKIEKL